MQTQPGGYNFANLVIDYTLHFLGEQFLDTEEAKPFGERHQVVQWMNAYVEHCQRLEREGKTNPGASRAIAAMLRPSFARARISVACLAMFAGLPIAFILLTTGPYAGEAPRTKIRLRVARSGVAALIRR